MYVCLVAKTAKTLPAYLSKCSLLLQCSESAWRSVNPHDMHRTVCTRNNADIPFLFMKFCRSTIRIRCCRYPFCRKTLHHPTRPRVTLLLISLVGIIILSMASNDFKDFSFTFYKLQNAFTISRCFWLEGEISFLLEKGWMIITCHWTPLMSTPFRFGVSTVLSKLRRSLQLLLVDGGV